jgi:hypothetical protein
LVPPLRVICLDALDQRLKTVVADDERPVTCASVFGLSPRIQKEMIMYGRPGLMLQRTFLLALMVPAIACGKKKDSGGFIDSSASTSDTTPAVPTALHVTEVVTGKGLNPDKSLKDETDEFGVRDTVYVGVKTEGASSGAKLTAKWTYQTGQGVSESSQNIAPAGAEVRHEFHIQKSDEWPKGDYKVEIMLNGVCAGA